MPPLTLTTDFGTADTYVAQMKGVILARVPTATIVDATHAVPPQDVRRAALLVADLADAFPPGSVHVAVVDPGVGTCRAILAAAAGGQFYLAPDNGLLTVIFDRQPAAAVHAVTNPQHRRAAVSQTFHGRDIFAPAAAALLAGVPIEELGPRVTDCVRLDGLTAMWEPDGLVGHIAWADHFGNLVTTIPAAWMPEDPARLRLCVGQHTLHGLRQCYADVPPGTPLVLVGSSGRLEIAVNGGSAAAVLQITAGTVVRVSVGDPVAMQTP